MDSHVFDFFLFSVDNNVFIKRLKRSQTFQMHCFSREGEHNNSVSYMCPGDSAVNSLLSQLNSKIIFTARFSLVPSPDVFIEVIDGQRKTNQCSHHSACYIWLRLNYM